MFKLSSDISRNEEQLNELKTYRQFLYNLAPQEWRDKHQQLSQKHSKEPASEAATEEVRYYLLDCHARFFTFPFFLLLCCFLTGTVLHSSAAVAGHIHRARGAEPVADTEQPRDRGVTGGGATHTKNDREENVSTENNHDMYFLETHSNCRNYCYHYKII